MTLGAKAHCFRERDSLTVSEAELVVVGGVVTAQAGERPVAVLEALMEFIEFGRGPGLHSRFRGRMTGAAGYGDGLSSIIQGSGFDAGLDDGLTNGDREAFGSGWDWIRSSDGRSRVIQGEIRQNSRDRENEDRRHDCRGSGLAPTGWGRRSRGGAWKVFRHDTRCHSADGGSLD